MLKYFKDLLAQEGMVQKAVRNSIDLSSILANKKEPTQPVQYPTLHKFMNQMEVTKEGYRMEQKALLELLEKQVVKTLVDEHNEYNKIHCKLQESVLQKDKKMLLVNQQNVEISSKFTKFFFDMVTNNKSSNDFYLEKLKFMQTQKELIQIHRTMGEEILVLWERLLHLQYNRLQTYQKVFNVYLTYKNQHCATSGASALEHLHNLNPIEECENEFSIKSLISQDKQTTLLTMLELPPSHKLTLSDLKGFLVHFEMEPLKKDPLIVNQVKVLRDVGTITSSFKVYTVLFTVDNRLLFIRQAEQNS